MRGLLALAMVLLVLFSGCSQKKTETGILRGNVDIGPLCPVEPCQVTPGQKEMALRETGILIYDRAKTAVVKQTSPDANGNYRVELEPGIYVVDTPRTGIGGALGLPKEIAVEAGKTITLDISIDTGIR